MRAVIKQFQHCFLMKPIARLIEENAERAFGETDYAIWWPASVDALLDEGA